MGLKYIENTGRDVIFVGGKLIPPGEGREIDESVLPPELQDKQPEQLVDAGPSLAELIAEFLKGNVKEVKAGLHDLTGEGLDLVDTIEGGAETPRSTVLEAVKAERIRRANAALEEEQAQKDFEAAVALAYQKQLDALTPEQLAALGEDQKTALRAQAELDVKAAAGSAGA
ncbi:MAG: hypothetical protein JNK17_02090 [Hydrogenophaga sp.]|nr:hypothetical protein [Hydrogenophaga sp.]